MDFFRADTIQHAFDIIESIFHMNDPVLLANGALYDLGLSKPNFIVLVISLLLLLLADVCKYRGVKVRNVILNLNIIIRWTIIIVGILGILILESGEVDIQKQILYIFSFETERL